MACCCQRKAARGLIRWLHKASAGTLIKSTIYHCPTLAAGLATLKSRGFPVVGLAGGADQTLAQAGKTGGKTVFVLGNETTGLDEETLALCDELAARGLHPPLLLRYRSILRSVRRRLLTP